MTVHEDLRLGWVQKPRDPRNMRLAKYTTAALAAPPKKVDWYSKVPSWPLYGNDRIGDCEVAACAHAVQALSLYGSSAEDTVADADVLRAYEALTGYDPASGANDNGVASLDMLNYWRTTGVGGRRISAYVEVDTLNHTEVRQALNLAGALLVGINMPLSAGNQFKQHKTWTPVQGRNGQPGSWGGHAVHVCGYDARGLTLTTWGAVQRMSWSFWEECVVEAFAPISPQWFNSAGNTPEGIDLSALLGDLHQLTGH